MLRSCLALALACAASSATNAAAAEPYEFHQKVLANGLRVVTLEDHSSPIVAVQVWYHVGSKDEDAERQGFAHMFEHMMFRGTDRLGPEDHFELIRGAGGDCNAYTTFDQTVYVQELPSNQLPMVLWLEAERMSALKVDQAGFDTERAVVEEERRMGLNQPYGSVLEKVLDAVYDEHPYRWSTIGNIEHLRRATAEELLRFWETYYVPNNAVLVVVGDVDHHWVDEEAEKAFGWIPRCADPPRITAQEPLPGEPRTIEIVEERGPAPIVAAAWRTVPIAHEDALPLEFLMSILGGGESSRLFRRIVDEEEAAPMAMAAALNLEQDGFAAAAALVMPFGDLDRALALIEEEVKRIQDEPVSDAELRKARTQQLSGLVTETTTVASKAGQIGAAALFHGGPDYLNEREARIQAVTAEDLTRVARTYLVPERRYTVRIEPTIGGMLKSLLGGAKKGDEAGEPEPKPSVAAADGADQPPAPERQGPKAEAQRPDEYPASAPKAQLVDVDFKIHSVEKRLANGMKVVVVENHEVPFVSARLGIPNGAFTEAKPGTASLACAMLTKGTKQHTAQELAAELETNAVSLGANASMDTASVRGGCVTAQVGRLFRLMGEVVQQPSFPASEFEKLKRQVLTGMAISEKSPETMASRAFARALYGEHPYGRDADGTSEDVKAVTAADCAAWWRAFARPDQAVLYVAGDMKAADAFELAEAVFGAWKVEGEAPVTELPPLPETPATSVVLVDVPGAIQSQIRVGHRAFTRDDARYATGRVLSQVFGGSFNSRLNKTIRVEKGLTYGAFGGLSSSRFDGRFAVSTFSKTATTAEAVRAILGEVERMRSEPPSTQELDQARSYLVGSFAGNHETPESIVSELWSIESEDLGVDFIGRYLKGVVDTKAEDVARVADEVIDPEHLVIVVAGDAARIQNGLREIATVTVLNEDGTPKVTDAAPPDATEGPAGTNGDE